jgi:hypothetical protein
MTKLTHAQARTIRRVLESGGDVLLTQGRLYGPGRRFAVQKVATANLIDRGLLEGHPLWWFAGTYSSEGQNEPMDHMVFATAAGCRALNAYEEDAAAREL